MTSRGRERKGRRERKGKEALKVPERHHCGHREHRRSRGRCGEVVGQSSFRHITAHWCSSHLAARPGLMLVRVVMARHKDLEHDIIVHELKVVKIYLKEPEKNKSMDCKSKPLRPCQYIFNFLRRKPLMTRIGTCPPNS